MTETKPTQVYWDAVLRLYAAACKYQRNSNSNYRYFSGMDLPKDVDTFISSKVPWRYQDIQDASNSASKKGLCMVRRWATMTDNGLFLVVDSDFDGRTVAGVYEITGLFYNDGTVLIWEMGSPIETAQLATDWKTRANMRPIDDAHLDVVLFNVPRTVEIPRQNQPNPGSNRPVTVQGTVRQVLHAINVKSLNVQYIGLKRAFHDAISKSTVYSTLNVDGTQWFNATNGYDSVDGPGGSQRGLGVIMSFERAKWQAKIKHIVGEEGGLDDMATGEMPKLGRKSALGMYDIPNSLRNAAKTKKTQRLGLAQRLGLGRRA